MRPAFQPRLQRSLLLRLRRRGEQNSGVRSAQTFPRPPSVGPFCTNCHPNRPFTHKLPTVIELSSGDVAFTITLSCTCSVSVHPTPQYGQIVSVSVCLDSSHVPAPSMSCSGFAINAPVGQTA